jgi:hypothetical protein
MVDPKFSSDSGVMTDNTVMLNVQRMGSRVDIPDLPANLLIFNQGMRYVYQFFKGSVSKSELDNAISEIMKSKNPDYRLTKNFKGKDYVFSYNYEVFGTITIEFKTN